LQTTAASQDDMRHLYVTFFGCGAADAPPLQEIAETPIAIATAKRKLRNRCLAMFFSLFVRPGSQTTSNRIPFGTAASSKEPDKQIAINS
jgi:hypothetical protein